MLNTTILDKLQASSTEKAKKANSEKPINPYAFRDGVQDALQTIGKAFVVENEHRANETRLGNVCVDLACCPPPNVKLSNYMDGIYIYCGSSRINITDKSLDMYIDALITVRDELKTLEAKMKELAPKVDFANGPDDDDDDDWD